MLSPNEKPALKKVLLDYNNNKYIKPQLMKISSIYDRKLLCFAVLQNIAYKLRKNPYFEGVEMKNGMFGKFIR